MGCGRSTGKTSKPAKINTIIPTDPTNLTDLTDPTNPTNPPKNSNIIMLSVLQLKEALQTKKKIDFSKISFEKIQADISKAYSFVKPNQKAIILLGDTDAGKSTLANYITDVSLKGKKTLKGLVIETTDPNSLQAITNIGQHTVSETTAPVCLLLNDIVLWDTPGFGDTRGPNIDIPNCYSIKAAFENSEQIKIIFVVSESTILDRSSFWQSLVSII